MPTLIATWRTVPAPRFGDPVPSKGKPMTYLRNYDIDPSNEEVAEFARVAERMAGHDDIRLCLCPDEPDEAECDRIARMLLAKEQADEETAVPGDTPKIADFAPATRPWLHIGRGAITLILVSAAAAVLDLACLRFPKMPLRFLRLGVVAFVGSVTVAARKEVVARRKSEEGLTRRDEAILEAIAATGGPAAPPASVLHEFLKSNPPA